MRRRAPRHTFAALAVVVVLGPAGASAATRSVTVGNDFFAPKTITVGKGDKVKWVWKSNGRKHNVASPAFGDSGNRRRGSYVVRFTLAGRFQYFCFLHEGMSGTVVVRR